MDTLPFSSALTSSLTFSLSSGSVGSPLLEGILLGLKEEVWYGLESSKLDE